MKKYHPHYSPPPVLDALAPLLLGMSLACLVLTMCALGAGSVAGVAGFAIAGALLGLASLGMHCYLKSDEVLHKLKQVQEDLQELDK